MNVLVLYQSRNGHTREAAEAIAHAAHDLKYEVVIKSVNEVTPADINKADRLFVGTWVSGLILFGVKPAGAELWVPALPSLNGKRVGVFCTYAFNPRESLFTLGEMLKSRGATVVGEHAFHRSRPTEGAAQFVHSVLHWSERVPA